jgi:hypothetical protein
MPLDYLKQVKVAAPCPVMWSEMEGDEQVRHCKNCNHNVFNLSGLSSSEAESLLREKNGKLCVRFYQRADGSVMTKDCPRGVAALRRQVVMAAFVMVSLLATAVSIAISPSERGAAAATAVLHYPATDGAHS